ncbi:MAG: Tim44/TimA family putative adaptor protein [Pseudomonadota bacterium]
MDPVTLIFAGIALFSVFKLISMLGARTGHEQSPDIEGLQRARSADPDTADKTHADDNQDSYDQTREDEATKQRPQISVAAAPLIGVDPDFDEKDFINGAKAAYEMIVQGFADGDIKPLKPYLARDVYDAFDKAASEREAAGTKYELTFVGIESAKISAAEVLAGEMRATVAFMSNQVRSQYDKAGDLIDGDPSRVDLVRDEWTFSRSSTSTDPNWTLVATSA